LQAVEGLRGIQCGSHSAWEVEMEPFQLHVRILCKIQSQFWLRHPSKRGTGTGISEMKQKLGIEFTILNLGMCAESNICGRSR